MTTASQMIQLAFKNAGVRDNREPLSGQEMTEGLDRINEILSNWSANGLTIPFNETVVVNVIKNQATYSVSPVIVEFLEGQLVSSDNVVSPLRYADAYTANRFNFTNTVGRPYWIFISEDANFINIGSSDFETQIKLYPTPNDNYTANLKVKQILSTLTLYETILNVPPWYLKCLRYQLTMELSAEYNTQLTEAFYAEYQRLMTQLEASTPKDMHVNIDNTFDHYRRYKPWGRFYVG